MNNYSAELLDFIKKSPTAYNAVAEAAERFEKMGCKKLEEGNTWNIKAGESYYVTRNGSSLIAFSIPKKGYAPFKIVASHSDSPIFKLKDNFEIKGEAYLKLDTEKYGGMIMSTWFDRPLSIAGRIALRRGDTIKTEVFDLGRPVAVITNMPIHFNRAVNDGYAFNAQIDMLPIAGSGKSDGDILGHICKKVGVDEKDIISHDIFLYCAQQGEIIGVNGEYILSPRIDDLACVYSSIKAFEAAGENSGINVCCIFDNEEVGSGTKQGADSTFLDDVINRIGEAFGAGAERRAMALSSSIMVSADNAHGVHPNHPEKYDELNRAKLNGGIVIKYNANQKYTSDAVSSAIFKRLCEKENIPTQSFANRSDVLGGSTLGNISNSHISVNTVDIGIAQLAMHSAVETAGTDDIEYMVRAMTAVYNSEIRFISDGEYEVK